MAVEVKSGPPFETTAPKSLFETRILGRDFLSHYAVSADGQRFLVNTILEATSPEPIHVVVNWMAELPKN